jgi:hypothetical protein
VTRCSGCVPTRAQLAVWAADMLRPRARELCKRWTAYRLAAFLYRQPESRSRSTGCSQLVNRFHLALFWSTISRSLIFKDLKSATHIVSRRTALSSRQDTIDPEASSSRVLAQRPRPHAEGRRSAVRVSAPRRRIHAVARLSPPRTLYSPVMISTGRVVLEMKRAGNA